MAFRQSFESIFLADKGKNMRRVADILAEELSRLGLKQIFMITGGGAMHLNDAFGRCKKFDIFFNHHEQACSLAAESFCRLSGKPAIVNVTSGPGGINALNGVYGAYVDSIGMVVVSGQIKRETMAKNYPLPLRQLGDQEVDIIAMSRPIVKYAVELQDPRRVREVAAKAVYLAQNGRPGPTWIDVPLDIQGMLVDENTLIEWDSTAPGALAELRGDPAVTPNTLGDFHLLDHEDMKQKAQEISRRLRNAKRPILLLGTGVRISGCHDSVLKLAAYMGIPTVTAWNAHDAMPDSHVCYCGRPGTLGNRTGNFAVQNADFLLTLGCRLNVRQISYDWKNFAPKAWKAHVDIDPTELLKPTLSTNLPVHADLSTFLPILREALGEWEPLPEHRKYLAWCKERLARYPVVNSKHRAPGKVNPYHFMDTLFKSLKDDDIVVTGNGSACVISFQAATIRPGTRLYTNSGNATMGYDLPAAIGATLATGKKKRIICLAGDGSIMMNLQELASISGANLPIIIYVLNNNGYHSIRQTQTSYFSDNMLGLTPATGVYFPDFMKVASAFGFSGLRFDSNQHVEQFVAKSLQVEGPAFYEIILDENQFFEPKLVSRKLADGTMVSPRLDDMAPFLPQEELLQNRLVEYDS